MPTEQTMPATPSRYMCPHCGRIFALNDTTNCGLIRTHYLPSTGVECPGSWQNPRNPDSDKRPLWKDGGEE